MLAVCAALLAPRAARAQSCTGLGFGSPVASGSLSTPSAVAVGDLNADGKLDVVVADATAGQIQVLVGNGGGTFTPRLPFSVGTGSSPSDAVVADFNRDGKLDLAVANAGTRTVAIFRGQGDGTFTGQGRVFNSPVL